MQAKTQAQEAHAARRVRFLQVEAEAADSTTQREGGDPMATPQREGEGPMATPQREVEGPMGMPQATGLFKKKTMML